MRSVPTSDYAHERSVLYQAIKLQPDLDRELTRFARAILMNPNPGGLKLQWDRLLESVSRSKPDSDTVDEFSDYLHRLSERLATVGDDAQLANIDLQQMLQKCQQTLQLMANVSKMNHDTSMSIVRKIG